MRTTMLFLAVLLAVKTFVRWMPTLRSSISWLPNVPGWLPLTVSVGVSVVGIVAVYFWLRNRTRDDPTASRPVFLRRFWVLAIVVVTINGTWQFFRAWLPLPDAAASALAEIAPAPPGAGASARLKVLLAEDHPVNRRVIELMLNMAGAEMTAVAAWGFDSA